MHCGIERARKGAGRRGKEKRREGEERREEAREGEEGGKIRGKKGEKGGM